MDRLFLVLAQHQHFCFRRAVHARGGNGVLRHLGKLLVGQPRIELAQVFDVLLQGGRVLRLGLHVLLELEHLKRRIGVGAEQLCQLRVGVAEKVRHRRADLLALNLRAIDRFPACTGKQHVPELAEERL